MRHRLVAPLFLVALLAPRVCLAQDEPSPFSRFESPSLMLRMQSLVSTVRPDEQRIGGAIEYGTPGPGRYDRLDSGLAIRGHLDGGWLSAGGTGGGYLAPGARVALAWSGELRSTDVAFGFGALATPVLSFAGGAQRLSFAVEPGVFFRWHVFGLMAGTPVEVELYDWDAGPWNRGAFGGALAGVSIAAGLFIPGNRW